MLTITLISPGKTKETWLEEALSEYQKRLRGRLQLEVLWVKNDSQLEEAVLKHSEVICLDPKGKELDSLGFAQLLEKSLVKGGSRLALVIGGAEGLPDSLRLRYPLLSLSRLTLTHQITRLLLCEQIYRASEIWRGSPYHK